MRGSRSSEISIESTVILGSSAAGIRAVAVAVPGLDVETGVPAPVPAVVVDAAGHPPPEEPFVLRVSDATLLAASDTTLRATVPVTVRRVGPSVAWNRGPVSSGGTVRGVSALSDHSVYATGSGSGAGMGTDTEASSRSPRP